MSLLNDWSSEVIVTAIFVAGLVTFWDFRFRSGQRRALRLLCWLLAIGALICLYLEPAFRVSAPQKAGAIFTAPISAVEKDSILQNKELVEIESAPLLGDIPFFVEEIQLHGDGLDAWQLANLDGYSIDWKRPLLPEGITDLQVPEITEGVPFYISGNLSLKQNLNLVLVDPEGNFTDEQISVAHPRFQFASQVKTAGLFEYRLLALRQRDTVFAERFAVKVEPSRRVNLLLLGSFPSFEWNYLKNHLADLGFGVASRFQLSQEVNHTEFLNLPRLNLATINSKLLEQFRLVLIDGNAFEDLSKRQKQAIFKAVELAEVGLFLMTDDLTTIEKITSINTVRGEGEVSVNTSQKQVPLLKMPFGISDPNWEQVNFQGQEIGTFTRRGIGKIGFSMIANSHILELQGASEVYGQLWDQLLSPVIGFELNENNFYIPQFNFVNGQTDISFSYFGQPQVAIDGHLIPPVNSPVRLDFWTVRYWPMRTGWHTIQVNGKEEASFFVYGPKEWEVLRRSNKQAYNRLFFATNPVEDKQEREIEKPVSRWIAFMAFLLAVGGLWLERKLS